ncbi:ABC transporter substrate-binding protein [Ochrobactrum sp. BTU1]|uniref:ABC transporter substrate-binding protein n=1 Tax=Ochrobactrum sp. BTU1 TaxID=2840456 RepID=UPI001C03A43F|nr:ABC transporter substrate-binding protein [Ochrobactrum sp. BTU1]
MKQNFDSLRTIGRGVSFATFLLLAAAPSVVAGEMMGECEVTGEKGSMPFTPVNAGELTVQVNLPSNPGWNNGDTPDQIKDGYEYCLGANIAHRAGLNRVKIVNVAWDALVAGRTKDFDVALSQISVTEPRKKVVDFSTPYFHSDFGLLVKKGTVVDPDSIKKMRVAVQQSTTAADFVSSKLKPAEVKVYQDVASTVTALRAGQVDAVGNDTAVVLGWAKRSNGALEVPGQFSTGETYGGLYPKGSKNAEKINEIIKSLIDDGTVKSLSAKYLTPVLGADPASIPYIKM